MTPSENFLVGSTMWACVRNNSETDNSVHANYSRNDETSFSPPTRQQFPINNVYVKLLPWERIVQAEMTRFTAVYLDKNWTQAHFFRIFHEFTVTDLWQVICNTTTHRRKDKRIANMPIYPTLSILTFLTHHIYQFIKIIHEFSYLL